MDGILNRSPETNPGFTGDGKGVVELSDGVDHISCRVKSSIPGLLKAPDQGEMSQNVKESVNAAVSPEIKSGKSQTLSLTGQAGGFEQRGTMNS